MAMEAGEPRTTSFPASWLPWLGPLAIIGATAITALLVIFGPQPHAIVDPAGLWPEAAKFAVAEPADRLILLAWWLLPVALVVAGRLVGRRSTGSRIVLGAVTGIAVVISALALMRPPGEQPWWPGIGIVGLLGGAALTCALVASLSGSRWRFIVLSVLLLTATAMWLLPALISTPDHLRDPYDFMFTSDELAAPAIGALPLGGYTAQYVNLLGYPIAPLLVLLPQQATLIVVVWIVLLQVVAIIAAAAIPALAMGRRFLVGGLMLMAAPVVIVGIDSPSTPLSYYATIPLRVVLPVLLFVLLILLSRRTSGLTAGSAAVLGLAGGVTALNNADFGGAALVAVILAALLSVPSWRQRAVRLAALVGAAVAVPIVYATGLWMTGRTPDAASYLAFARAFGVNGFYQVPMESFGLHVICAGLFVAATALGAWRLNFRLGSSVEATSMLVTGAWGLLTLAYFAGRSLTPTLIGGTAFQVGLVAAALFPSAYRSIAAVRTRGGGSAIAAAAMSLVMIVGVLSLMFTGRPPKDSLVDAIDSQSGRPEALHGHLAGVSTGNTVFLLREGTLAELELGLPSGLVVNSPEAFMISPVFTSLQCEALTRAKAADVVVESDIAPFLAKDPLCTRVLRFQEAERDAKVWRIPLMS